MYRLDRILLLCLLALFSSTCLADATIPVKDIAAAKDPPWLKRYEGSFIVSYEHRAFDAADLPASQLRPVPGDNAQDRYNNQVVVAKATHPAEGEYTRLVYIAPEDRSPLELMRNYIDEIKGNGGTLLYGCQDQACGGAMVGNDHGGGTQGLLEKLYPQARNKDAAFSNGKCATTENLAQERYIVATMPTGAGEATLAVLTYSLDADGYCAALNGRTGVLVIAIQAKAREQKMFTVTATDMAKALASEGHIALYGLYFDTNKSVVKPESKATLDQIAQLLRQQPKLALSLVGHTDNVGGAEANLKLSKRRADAVANALIEDYGIDEARLQASGAGMTQPVATNTDENGRAKNRRVELVKR
jgi:outer membrane protein OmpA-like peptidoglycan-associated protein